MTGDVQGANADPRGGVRSPAMADTPKVVIGTRRSSWLGQRWKDLALSFASLPVFVWGVRWFIAMFREGHLFDDDHFGHTIGGGLIVGFITLVSGIYVAGLISSLRNVVLDSACPCCGANRRRNFGNPHSESPTACGACLAYLRANGLEVTEESLEAMTENLEPYEVSSERYLPAVRRDNHNHFEFRWPDMCSVCGAVATQRRDIGEWGKIQVDMGVLGEVVHIVGVEAGVAPRRDSEMIHHNPSPTTKSGTQQLDSELKYLRVPVCAKHTRDEWYGTPLKFKSGMLVFASYRYYKAFCELNQIGATLKSVTSTTGAPPASSPQ
jgi:hypothetical protein